MKSTFLFLLLLLLLPLSTVLQDLLPSLPPSQERIQLLPVFFCFGVLALPLVPALFFALATAGFHGLMIMQIQSGQAETGLVGPVVFFLGWAIILQMTSESTRGMRWEIHALGSALVTLTLLGGEFLLICAKRGGLPLDSTVMLRIAVPAGAALLLAPLLYLLLGSLVPLSRENKKSPLPNR
jgi:hypothetical protein